MSKTIEMEVCMPFSVLITAHLDDDGEPVVDNISAAHIQDVSVRRFGESAGESDWTELKRLLEASE